MFINVRSEPIHSQEKFTNPNNFNLVDLVSTKVIINKKQTLNYQFDLFKIRKRKFIIKVANLK